MNGRKITHEGEINLGGFSIPAYVLEDGTRVLSGHGMQRSLLLTDDRDGGGSRLATILSQKTLEPYIYREKVQADYEPLICYKGSQKINGYEATVLIDICDAFLEARKHIDLASRQQRIADQCEILVRGFARLGLIALIDEATGYQHDREKDELQKILDKYISEQLMPWQKTFPDIYYQELFRLNGWDFTVKGIKKRPSVIGKWTNKLIYEQLPPGVLEELKNKTPKSTKGNRTSRYFQSLTDDYGSPHLRGQLTQVITLFQLSDNMKHMWLQFDKLLTRQSGYEQLELELPYAFDEKGHTIEPIEVENLTEFDKNLITVLNYKE